MIDAEITRYFRDRVLKGRRFIKVEWCRAIIANPIKIEKQESGRIAYWGLAPEMKGRVKVLRVITLPNGSTLFNAFPDRDFQMKMSGEKTGAKE